MCIRPREDSEMDYGQTPKGVTYPTSTSSYWEWSASLARGPHQQPQVLPRGGFRGFNKNHLGALDQLESTRMMINTDGNLEMKSQEDDDETSDVGDQILRKLNFNDDLCLKYFPENVNTGTAFEPLLDQLQYLLPRTEDELETVNNSLGFCTPVDPLTSTLLMPTVDDSMGERIIGFGSQNLVNPNGSSDVYPETVRNELRKSLGNSSRVEPHDQSATILVENINDPWNVVVPEGEHGFSFSEIEGFKRDLERIMEFQDLQKTQLVMREESVNLLKKVLEKDAENRAFDDADDHEFRDIDIRNNKRNDTNITKESVAGCSGRARGEALSPKSSPMGSNICVNNSQSVRNKLRNILPQESQQYWTPKSQSRRNSISVNESLLHEKQSDEDRENVRRSRASRISQVNGQKDGFENSMASSTVNAIETDAGCPFALDRITRHGLQLIDPTAKANEAHLVLRTNARPDLTSASPELVPSEPLNSKGPNQFEEGLKDLRSSIFQCITELQGDIQTLKTRIGDILVPYTNESSKELQALSLLIKGVQETSESSVNQDIPVEVLSSDTLSTLQNFTDELEKELKYLVELRKRSSINQNEHSAEVICRPSVKSDNLWNSVAVNNIQDSENVSKGTADDGIKYFSAALNDNQAIIRNDNMKRNDNDNTQEAVLKNGDSGLGVRYDENRLKSEACMSEPGPISNNQYQLQHLKQLNHKFDKIVPSDSLPHSSASTPSILHEFIDELDQELTKRVHEYGQGSKNDLNCSLIPEDLLRKTSSVITMHLERGEQLEPSIGIYNDVDEMKNAVPPDTSHIAIHLNAISTDMLSTLMGFVDELHQELRRNINQRSLEAQYSGHDPETHRVTRPVNIIPLSGLPGINSKAGALGHRGDGHLEPRAIRLKGVDAEDSDAIPLEETEHEFPLSQLSMHTLCMLERFVNSLCQEFKGQILSRKEFVDDGEGQKPSEHRVDLKPKVGKVSLIHSYQRIGNFREEADSEDLAVVASPISKSNMPEISVDALSTDTLRVLKDLMCEMENELQKCTIDSHKVMESTHLSTPKRPDLSESNSTSNIPVPHETKFQPHKILSNGRSKLDVEGQGLISNDEEIKDSICQWNDVLMTPKPSIFETSLDFRESFKNTFETYCESNLPAESVKTISGVPGMSPGICSMPDNLIINKFGGRLEELIERCTRELKNEISCLKDKINEKDVYEPPSSSLLRNWKNMLSVEISDAIIGPLLQDLKKTLLDELSAFELKERDDPARSAARNALSRESLTNLTQAQKLSREEEQITYDILKDTDSAHKCFLDESRYLKKVNDGRDHDDAAQVDDRALLYSSKPSGHDCKAKSMDLEYKYGLKYPEPAAISDDEGVISNLAKEVHSTRFASDAKFIEESNYKAASGSGNDNLLIHFAQSNIKNSKADKGDCDQEQMATMLWNDPGPMKNAVDTDFRNDQQGECHEDISAEEYYETKTDQRRRPPTKDCRSITEKVVPVLQAKLENKRSNCKVIPHIRRVLLWFLELASCGLTDSKDKTSLLSEYGSGDSKYYILSKVKVYKVMRWTAQRFQECSPGTLTASSLRRRSETVNKFVDKGINVSLEMHWDNDWDDQIALDLGVQVDNEPTNSVTTTPYSREIYNKKRKASDFRNVAIDHDSQRPRSSLMLTGQFDQEESKMKLDPQKKLRDIYVAHDSSTETLRPSIWSSKNFMSKKADMQELAESIFTI